jgi:hypothetical protein
MLFALLKLGKTTEIRDFMNSGKFTGALTLLGIGDPSSEQAKTFCEALDGVAVCSIEKEQDAIFLTVKPLKQAEKISGAHSPGDPSSSSSSSKEGESKPEEDENVELAPEGGPVREPRKGGGEGGKGEPGEPDQGGPEEGEPIQGGPEGGTSQGEDIHPLPPSGSGENIVSTSKSKSASEIEVTKKFAQKQLVMFGTFFTFSYFAKNLVFFTTLACTFFFPPR